MRRRQRTLRLLRRVSVGLIDATDHNTRFRDPLLTILNSSGITPTSYGAFVRIILPQHKLIFIPAQLTLFLISGCILNPVAHLPSPDHLLARTSFNSEVWPSEEGGAGGRGKSSFIRCQHQVFGPTLGLGYNGQHGCFRFPRNCALLNPSYLAWQNPLDLPKSHLNLVTFSKLNKCDCA